MVYKIMKGNTFIFFEALLITLVLLSVGFSIGLYFESFRTSKVIQGYKNFEVEALDLKLQNYYFQTLNKGNCMVALEENINFADRLYDEGLIIQKYEDINQITEELLLEKKRYVLLKTELWLNSIILKERCKEPFHTVIYLYSNTPGQAKEAEQEAISNVLKDIKEKKGNQVILIPIAGDMELRAIDLQMKIYNITYLPSILIDEKYVLEGFHNTEEIEKYLK